MNSKIIFVVAFIAIFLGVASLSGLFRSEPKSKPSPQVVKVEPKVQFWRSKVAIPRGYPVDRAKLELVDLPVSKARRFHVTHDETIHFVPDMIARHAIQPGDVVRNSDVASPESSDYITLITPANKVAYPINVSAADIKSMAIHPSNRIDVLLLSSPGSNVNVQDSTYNNIDNLSVSMLFKGVKVVAVRDNNDTKQPSRVLVALSQEQVAKLIIALRIGKIYVFHTGSEAESIYRDVVVRDVLPSYSSVKELRGSITLQNQSQVN
ncbi:Flp pilus assembly protein CpaB [Celerinatantimonas diazotrophica]|uniref:Flp pilus assembly protein CpaB n=1 Tax=Celerinatantimonas diazotrophica TaxID=412034 RepID=UPI001404C547|nr:Flp pilus assembly protein CpaB [Celerinatantimonas diazotrophica]